VSESPVGTDLLEEARALVDLATERGIVLRLVGGIAVRILCPDLPARTRTGQDVDFGSIGSSRRPLGDLLVSRGYIPDKTFNALYGNKQLYFTHPEGWAVDVLIDKLEMCHTLDFAGRITRMPYTLDPLDLLLTKLQIVKLNEKDGDDCLRLLATFPVGESDEAGTMDLRVFRALLSDDWGWWRTVTMNLEKIRGLAAGGRAAAIGGRLDVQTQLAALAQAAEEAPKTRRWKIRARVGDRVRWYEEPEETAHHLE
jgi:hypothetical protein